ncbi:MAG: 16S rRNA (cytosine(967)-C(5))-methyltransferase RsmB [Gammaproteobacteria bacterium]|nr:16S rRNA (cytosine(967)-C(5))-methyltransferase RsmB [Gammaproteobacteria bacterium]
MNPRFVAARIIQKILLRKGSLSLLSSMRLNHLDKSLIQEMCYGTMRYYFLLDFLVKQLLEKPLKKKNQDIHALILIGLYQLLYMNIPEHTVIFETVDACKNFKKIWAKKLVNGVLREFSRRKDSITKLVEQDIEAKYLHTKWFIEILQKVWPREWENIVAANNQKPPMSLRLNLQKTTYDAYVKELNKFNVSMEAQAYGSSCIILKQPISVSQLPGFREGKVSVQDCGAQFAAQLLDLKPHQRILDACAAPGGKTTHILEAEPHIGELIALDIDEKRLSSIAQNLQRLNLRATLINADAAKPDMWWDGRFFDRILLDAPCSGTGVIRRHPDIKYLKTEKDIKNFSDTQSFLLKSLWALLKDEGKLLYVTCSILPDENQNVISAFIKKTPNAIEEKIQSDWGIALAYGRQILPGQQNMDGFYYCLLKKIVV